MTRADYDRIALELAAVWADEPEKRRSAVEHVAENLADAFCVVDTKFDRLTFLARAVPRPVSA